MFNVTLNGFLLTGGLGTEVIREEAQLRGGQCSAEDKRISQHRRFCLAHIMGTCHADRQMFGTKKGQKKLVKNFQKLFHPCKISKKR